jgi:hypothetical protein
VHIVAACNGEKVDARHRAVVYGTLVTQALVGRERILDDARIGRAVRALPRIH